MSSLQETSKAITEKRGTFLKRSSFQKFKCSAANQFQLAGSKFSKAALTQLFEKLMQSSRCLLQRAFQLLTLPAFKLLCIVILWCLDVFAKCFGIHFVCENDTTTKLDATQINFYVRIQRLHSIKSAKVAERNVPVATVRPQPPPAAIEPVGQEQSKRISTATPIKNRPNLLMIVGVYACAAFVYLEFLVLAVTLNASSTPPGLVFLVSSLGYIGFIVFKILKKTPKHDALEPVRLRATTPERFRISRSSTRKYLQLHNKTLSKVKLL